MKGRSQERPTRAGFCTAWFQSSKEALQHIIRISTMFGVVLLKMHIVPQGVYIYIYVQECYINSTYEIL